MKTQSKILDISIDFHPVHIALIVKEQQGANPWLCDSWTILLNGQSFEYFTGTGHRKEYPAGPDFYRGKFAKIQNKNYKKTTENLLKVAKVMESCSKPRTPSLDDVLYSLVIDSDAGEYSFNDWCENSGYNPDSMSAFKTYTACQENAEKLLKAIPGLDLNDAMEKFSEY